MHFTLHILINSFGLVFITMYKINVSTMASTRGRPSRMDEHVQTDLCLGTRPLHPMLIAYIVDMCMSDNPPNLPTPASLTPQPPSQPLTSSTGQTAQTTTSKSQTVHSPRNTSPSLSLLTPSTTQRPSAAQQLTDPTASPTSSCTPAGASEPSTPLLPTKAPHIAPAGSSNTLASATTASSPTPTANQNHHEVRSRGVSPAVSQQWTPEEVEALKTGVRTHGLKWCAFLPMCLTRNPFAPLPLSPLSHPLSFSLFLSHSPRHHVIRRLVRLVSRRVAHSPRARPLSLQRSHMPPVCRAIVRGFACALANCVDFVPREGLQCNIWPAYSSPSTPLFLSRSSKSLGHSNSALLSSHSVTLEQSCCGSQNSGAY